MGSSMLSSARTTKEPEPEEAKRTISNSIQRDRLLSLRQEVLSGHELLSRWHRSPFAIQTRTELPNRTVEFSSFRENVGLVWN